MIGEGDFGGAYDDGGASVVGDHQHVFDVSNSKMFMLETFRRLLVRRIWVRVGCFCSIYRMEMIVLFDLRKLYIYRKFSQKHWFFDLKMLKQCKSR